MKAKTIVTIVGARPQFIKAAPVSRALIPFFHEVMVHTGQHYDYGMSDVFFEEMEIKKPEFNLGIGGGTHAEQTGLMLIELEKILTSVKPDCILVYGDTNSTLAGALAAAKAGIPLAHVEAGLRSYDRTMPEEVNRVLTDHVSNLLFCPTDAAVKNLAKEGIVQGVHRVGDVMYDALLYNLANARAKSKILDQLGLKKGGYALATVHRAANTDSIERMRSILDGLGKLDTQVIFPVHPRTRKTINEWEISTGANVLMVEPVGYFDMLVLQENSNCILTDSGGVQKEAYLAGVRCITLREDTEWVETVAAGWNKLVGVNTDLIVDTYKNWHPQGERAALYGDGHSAVEISKTIFSALR
ncbi:MAG: UDP-N-acetylglucosamine 2-epimerase (non-hydrolyzing) [Anaerolineales bacterium]|nr:UDP-N-acetylglucosamine 2-epimerase (non-hydrolyzing) [Anaerolineales bacterium]